MKIKNMKKNKIKMKKNKHTQHFTKKTHNNLLPLIKKVNNCCELDVGPYKKVKVNIIHKRRRKNSKCAEFIFKFKENGSCKIISFKIFNIGDNGPTFIPHTEKNINSFQRSFNYKLSRVGTPDLSSGLRPESEFLYRI
jgi:hypothetical protein